MPGRCLQEVSAGDRNTTTHRQMHATAKLERTVRSAEARRETRIDHPIGGLILLSVADDRPG